MRMLPCFRPDDTPGAAGPVANTPAPVAPVVIPPLLPPTNPAPDLARKVEELIGAQAKATERADQILSARKRDSLTAALPDLADPDYVHLPAVQSLVAKPEAYDEFGGLTAVTRALLADLRKTKPHLFRQQTPGAPRIPDLPAADPAGSVKMSIEEYKDLKRKDPKRAMDPAILRAMGFLKPGK